MSYKEGRKTSIQFIRALGVAMRFIRTERNMTAHELAELSGVHYNTIQKLESGRTANLTVCVLFQILVALQTDITRIEKTMRMMNDGNESQ